MCPRDPHRAPSSLSLSLSHGNMFSFQTVAISHTLITHLSLSLLSVYMVTYFSPNSSFYVSLMTEIIHTHTHISTNTYRQLSSRAQHNPPRLCLEAFSTTEVLRACMRTVPSESKLLQMQQNKNINMHDDEAMT